MATEIQAVAYYASNDLFVCISPGGHALTLDTSSERNAAPTPIELLLMAAGACMGSDVVAILQKKHQQISDYRVEVRGTRREEFPRSFTRITLHHIVRGRQLSETAVQQAIELSNTKYCGVAATLRPTATVDVSYELIEDAGAAE